MEIEMAKHCLTCNSITDFILRDGDLLCTNCGTIQIDHVLHEGPDWTNYQDDHSRTGNLSRVGPMESVNPFSSLGTTIPASYKTKFIVKTEDGIYKKCDLRKAQIIVSSNNRETTFNKILGIFSELQVRHGIGRNTIGIAIQFWKQIAESKEIFKASNRDGLIAACIYHACLETCLPIPPKEIAKMMDVTEHILLEGDKILRNRLNLNSSKQNVWQNEQQMLISYIEKLNLKYRKYVPICTKLYVSVQDKLSRIGIASALGGVIGYTVFHTFKLENPTREEIRKVVGISKPTLTKAMNIIIQAKEN
jgi:transcription initiation factor TFIIIB Brf1 subunit/transcription initiation factor TFIIB